MLKFSQRIAGLDEAREAHNILDWKNFSEMSNERNKMSSRQQPSTPWSDLIVFLRFNLVGKEGTFHRRQFYSGTARLKSRPGRWVVWLGFVVILTYA
jgi:hypothetical protein